MIVKKLVFLVLCSMAARPVSSQDAARLQTQATFLAGASAVDISPERLPVRQNGGFLEATANRIVDPLFARALVLDDGKERLAIVVVDSCMVPRVICDDAKERAGIETGIRRDRVLISATHTHYA